MARTYKLTAVLRIRPPGGGLKAEPREVWVTVDWDALARQLAEKAGENASRRTRAMGGAIVASLTKPRRKR